MFPLRRSPRKATEPAFRGDLKRFFSFCLVVQVSSLTEAVVSRETCWQL